MQNCPDSDSRPIAYLAKAFPASVKVFFIPSSSLTSQAMNIPTISLSFYSAWLLFFSASSLALLSLPLPLSAFALSSSFLPALLRLLAPLRLFALSPFALPHFASLSCLTLPLALCSLFSKLLRSCAISHQGYPSSSSIECVCASRLGRVMLRGRDLLALL